jgi:hypothetical protein
LYIAITAKQKWLSMAALMNALDVVLSIRKIMSDLNEKTKMHKMWLNNNKKRLT